MANQSLMTYGIRCNGVPLSLFCKMG